MANTVTSPNMNLVLPVVGVDPGPDWATRLDNALLGVDAHDHTSGKGVPITPAAININADLSFASFNATTLRSARFASQASALVLGSDLGCLYNVGGDAFWNNGSGTAIRLTQAGQINAQFTSWPTKTNATGTFTILSTDAFVEYLCKTGVGAVAPNLPASNSLTIGRTYTFEDADGNSETNAITITPNGTDTINGVNAAYVFQLNRGWLSLITDGAGNWFATGSGPSYLRQAGLTFAASGTITTSANGNLVLATNGTGIVQTKPGGILAQQFVPWVGSFDVQNGGIIDIPVVFKTTDASVHNVNVATIPNNTSFLALLTYVARHQATPGDCVVAQALVPLIGACVSSTVTVVAGTFSSQATGTNPSTSVAFAGSGQNLQLSFNASSSTATEWQFLIKLIIC